MFADAHVYGAFNLAYGIGSALGPIVGGQVCVPTIDGRLESHSSNAALCTRSAWLDSRVPDSYWCTELCISACILPLWFKPFS
jgi:hypothetical protein